MDDFFPSFKTVVFFFYYFSFIPHTCISLSSLLLSIRLRLLGLTSFPSAPSRSSLSLSLSLFLSFFGTVCVPAWFSFPPPPPPPFNLCARAAIPTAAYKFTCCSLLLTRLLLSIVLFSSSSSSCSCVGGSSAKIFFLSFFRILRKRGKRRKHKRCSVMCLCGFWIVRRRSTSSPLLLLFSPPPVHVYTPSLSSLSSLSSLLLSRLPSRIHIRPEKGPTKLQGPLGKRLLKKAKKKKKVCVCLAELVGFSTWAQVYDRKRRRGPRRWRRRQKVCKKRTRPVYRF